jgi:hypothetical protein
MWVCKSASGFGCMAARAPTHFNAFLFLNSCLFGQRMNSHVKKIAARFVAAIVCAAFSSVSVAATQWCQGTITHAWVASDGSFYVLPSWRGDHIRLCSVKTTLSDAGVSALDPATCKSWVAITLQAIAGNKSTIITYADAPACNAMPHYHWAPLPWYVMIAN